MRSPKSFDGDHHPSGDKGIASIPGVGLCPRGGIPLRLPLRGLPLFALLPTLFSPRPREPYRPFNRELCGRILGENVGSVNSSGKVQRVATVKLSASARGECFAERSMIPPNGTEGVVSHAEICTGPRPDNNSVHASSCEHVYVNPNGLAVRPPALSDEFLGLLFPKRHDTPLRLKGGQRKL